MATSPPATATINARNWIHAPTNTPNRLGSSRLPSAPLAKNPTNRNSPANAPTTGTHRHGNRATTVAATTRITRPGGTVGTSIPEKIWIANPKAATRRAATVSLLAEDKELGRFIEFLLSVVVNDLAFRGIFRRAQSDHHLAPATSNVTPVSQEELSEARYRVASATSSGTPIRPRGNDAATASDC